MNFLRLNIDYEDLPVCWWFFLPVGLLLGILKLCYDLIRRILING